MTNNISLDIKENDICVFSISNDIVLSSSDGDTQLEVILTIKQLDKLYEDAMRIYGEPTPAEQEDKILSLENKLEKIENLVEQYQER